MKKKRRIIAVIICELEHEFQNKIMLGLNEQALLLGYDVAVFTMPLRGYGASAFQTGEENIYNLINYDMVDGVIFASGILSNEVLSSTLDERLHNANIPTLALDYESKYFESVYIDDESSFEKLIDHFIEVHNCKDIFCLTGFKDNMQAESRLQGYKNSLTKHNIQINDKRIRYGDFWRPAALELANDLITKKIKMPEVIACANDEMAVTLCNALTDVGIMVPEDVMISGFDASDSACDNIPSITTYKRANYMLGVHSVIRLHKMITGETVEPCKYEYGLLQTAESCGCGEDLNYQIQEHKTYLNDVKKFELMYENSNMSEKLLESETLESLILQIDEFTYLINNLDKYSILLCENWDYMDNDGDVREGYDENMQIQFMKSNGVGTVLHEHFKSSNICPYFFTEDEPGAYYFSPIHFRDMCFGYSIIKFLDNKISFQNLYKTWCRNINNGFEFLRVQNHLKSLNQRIILNSIRDTLTGIYNRKGLMRYSDEVFNRAKSEHKSILLLVADLDMLKTINDNYGHLEGDNAITIAANALNTCCKYSEICARTGGDEYLIMGCFDYTDEIIDSYKEYIYDYLERYNNSSNKPYPVEISLGHYCGIPEKDRDLQFYLDIADKEMYNNKVMRKKQRLS